jgi:hypothetical protein
MNNSAIAMPEMKLSGVSGAVRQNKPATGQRKATTRAALREAVRRVRQIFYCLTYTRARVAVESISINLKISLRVNNLPDRPDKVKEVFVFVLFLLSGCRFILPDTAGQAGQRGN